MGDRRSRGGFRHDSVDLESSQLPLAALLMMMHDTFDTLHPHEFGHHLVRLSMCPKAPPAEQTTSHLISISSFWTVHRHSMGQNLGAPYTSALDISCPPGRPGPPVLLDSLLRLAQSCHASGSCPSLATGSLIISFGVGVVVLHSVVAERLAQFAHHRWEESEATHHREEVKDEWIDLDLEIVSVRATQRKLKSRRAQSGRISRLLRT